MIRINVLPVERVGPRKVYLELAGAGLVVVLAVAGVIYTAAQQSFTIQEKEAAKVQKKKRLEELQQILNQIKQFEEEKNMLQKKLDTINNLKANQRGPVQLLEEISRKLPKGVWLTRMTQRDADLTMDGYAMTLHMVADFMRNLQEEDKPEAERRFGDIALSSAEKVAVEGGEISRFALRCRYKGK